MVIVISNAFLGIICIALALPYVVIGARALLASRPIPHRHGLRDWED